MSRINFGNLAAEHPKLTQTFRRLGGWFDEHEDVTMINSLAVASALQEDPSKLARALFMLVDRGELQQYYQLQTPQGILVGPLYDDPVERLPDTVEGRLLEKIPTDECLLVPVFKVPHGGATRG